MKFKNKKGVFGLTAVQSFFAIILGIGLLAFVIVIIMGTLSNTALLPKSNSGVINETLGYINNTGYKLATAGASGFGGVVISLVGNGSDYVGGPILPGNWTLAGGDTLYNRTVAAYPNVTITYTYTFDSLYQGNLNAVTSNVSSGVSGFFLAINPVYAILAVLIIILVLVVLVRVVQTPGGRMTSPQL